MDADASDPTTFVLEARLWTGLPGDRAGILEFSGVTPTWVLSSNPPGLRLSSSSGGYRATVTLDPGTKLTGPVTVQALAGGIGAQSQIVPVATASEDGIEASYRDGSTPDAIVVRGLRTAADNPCAVWLAPALVRRGTVGQVTAECGGSDPPWGIAMLDAGHAMEMYPPKWSSGLEQTDATKPAAIRTIPLAMRILIGGGDGLAGRQTDAATFTTGEITDANTVLADNRAGIQLGTPHLEVVTAPASGEETSVPTCAAGDLLTSGYDYVPPTAPSSTPAMLHVYMVDRMGNKDGFSCAPTKARPVPVIYLRAGANSGTLLVHELGHVLGLDIPGAGHSDFLQGFDAANVMASGYADTDDVWRRRITVGQVVRMNADVGSWLNWSTDETGTMLRDLSAPHLACQCGFDDPTGQCPRLVDDFARERGGLRHHLHPWDCTDRIQLPAPLLGAEEKPLALIAGRPWGTSAGGCRRDIPGDLLTHDKADFIKFVNVTRSTGCSASWIAIFFRNQAPIFRDLTTLSGSWSDAAELRVLDRGPSAPRPVIVHVYFDPADDGLVTSGIEEIGRIYGQDSRAGLAFQFFRHTPLPATCPGDLQAEFHICWSSAAIPTLPQMLGAKLGLSILTAAELSDPAFAGNAMRPAPGAGSALTLGQMFRIHGSLVPTDFPDCTATASICPPLEADVKP